MNYCKYFTVSRIIELNLKDLDYFIYRTRDKTIEKNGKRRINMFSITSGNVSLPKIYEIAKTRLE